MGAVGRVRVGVGWVRVAGMDEGEATGATVRVVSGVV